MTHLEAVLQDIPQLLSLSIAGILNLQMASLGDNLLGGKGTLRVPPS